MLISLLHTITTTRLKTNAPSSSVRVLLNNLLRPGRALLLPQTRVSLRTLHLARVRPCCAHTPATLNNTKTGTPAALYRNRSRARFYYFQPTRIAWSAVQPTPAPQILKQAAAAASSSSHQQHPSSGMSGNNDGQDPAVRITRWGLYSNAGMVIVKGAGGYLLNSQSLIADAGHSVADLAADFLTLGTVSYAAQQVTPAYPNGYGKVETLGSLGVAGFLLVGGLGIGWSSGASVLNDLFGTHLDAHSHGSVDPNALWLCLASLAVKEWLYRATMKIAIEQRSELLKANAYHHRMDSLSSLVATVAIGGVWLCGWTWLDPVGGLLVALTILNAAWQTAKGALTELADQSIDSTTRAEMTTAAEEAVKALGIQAVKQVLGVQGQRSGPNYLLQVALAVEGTLPLKACNEIEELVSKYMIEHVDGVKRCDIKLLDAKGDHEAWTGLDKTIVEDAHAGHHH